jgi:hypothetical protein
LRQQRKRGALLAVLALGLISMAVTAALAQSVSQRNVELARSSSALLVSVGFQDLVDARGRQKLDSGFWNRMVVRVNTRQLGRERPISLAVRTCRVRYELWEEHYEVQIEDHRGRQSGRAANVQEAIESCTTLTRFPVASLSAMEEGRFQVEVIAELNPMSEELLDSIRRWLRSPQGGHRRIAQGDNFFGSVVSIFVNNRIGRSDRMVHFRSQTFSAPR